MRKFLSIILLAVTLQVYGNVSTHCEVVMTVPGEELVLTSGELAVVIGGHLIPVQTAERAGNLWKIRLDDNGIERCENGHRILCGCGGCGDSSCAYGCICLTDNPWVMQKER